MKKVLKLLSGLYIFSYMLIALQMSQTNAAFLLGSSAALLNPTIAPVVQSLPTLPNLPTILDPVFFVPTPNHPVTANPGVTIPAPSFVRNTPYVQKKLAVDMTLVELKKKLVRLQSVLEKVKSLDMIHMDTKKIKLLIITLM